MSLVLQNGNLVGTSNVSVLIGGVIVTGIKSINYKKDTQKENVYGFSKEPIGRSTKQTEYPPGTIEILLEEYKAIVAAAPNRDIAQIPRFNIPIVFDNGVIPADTINNVEFTSAEMSYKGGEGAIWVPINFIFAGINQ
jgi:hypothetical protein